MQAEDLVARVIGLFAAGVLAFACMLVMLPFLSALVGAAILAFCTWPLFRLLNKRLRLPRTLAALVMITLAFLTLGLPLLFAAPLRLEDIEAVRGWVELVMNEGLPDLSGVLLPIPVVGERLNESWQGLAGDTSQLLELLRPHAGMIAQQLFGAVTLVLSGLVEVLLAIALAFFFYRDGPAIAAHSYLLLRRLAGDQAEALWKLTGDVTLGVVYGLLGTALAQGFLTGVGFWIAGVPEPVLLGVLTAVISILPFGAPLVWVPVSLWLAASGSVWWGVFLMAWGMVVVSSVDNFLRPWLLSRGASLPLLLSMLGAIGGVVAFGFLGLFLGPVALAVAYALLLAWGRAGTEDAEQPQEPPLPPSMP